MLEITRGMQFMKMSLHIERNMIDILQNKFFHEYGNIICGHVINASNSMELFVSSSMQS